MSIKHNTYFDGRVQSIGFVEGETTTMTVGLVMSGEYDFGKAGSKETITVTTGAISFNGKLYIPAGDIPIKWPPGRTDRTKCVIEAGEEIKVEAPVPSSYVCKYG